MTTSGQDFRQKEQLEEFKKDFPLWTGQSHRALCIRNSDAVLSEYRVANCDVGSELASGFLDEEIAEYESAGPGWDQK